MIFFKQESVRFERARIDISGSILAGGHTLNLCGTVLVISAPPAAPYSTAARKRRWGVA